MQYKNAYPMPSWKNLNFQHTFSHILWPDKFKLVSPL